MKTSSPVILALLSCVARVNAKTLPNITENPFISFKNVISTTDETYDISRDKILDLGKYIPNYIAVKTPSNATSATISARGIVEINPAATYSSYLPIKFGNVHIDKTQGSLFPLINIDSIEFTSGSDGLKTGLDAIGGVLKVKLKEPEKEFSIQVDSELKTYNGKGVVAVFNSGQILNTKLSASTGFYRLKRNGFETNVAAYQPEPSAIMANLGFIQRGDLSSSLQPSIVDQYGANTTIQYSPDKKMSLLYRYDHDNSGRDNTPPFGQLVDLYLPNWSAEFGVPMWPIENYESDQAPGDYVSYNSNTQEFSKSNLHSLTVTFSSNFLDYKLDLGSRNLDWSDTLDLDGSPFAIAQTSRFTQATHRNLSSEVSKNLKSMFWMCGYEYVREKSYTNNPQTYFGGSQAINQNYSLANDVHSLYFNLIKKIMTFELDLGTRFSKEYYHAEKEYVGQFKYNPESETKNYMFPSASLVWKPSLYQPLTIFAKYGESSASMRMNPESSSSIMPMKSKNSSTFEMGFDVVQNIPLESLRVVAFLNNISMPRSYFSDDASAASLLIPHKYDTSGIEILSKIKIAHKHGIQLNYGYLDSSTKDFYLQSNTNIASKVALPYAPRHTLSCLANVYITSQVKLKFDYMFLDRYFTFPFTKDKSSTQRHAYTVQTKPSNLSNLSFEYQPRDDLSLVLWYKNLFNKRDIQSRIPFGPGFGGLTMGYFNDPATYGMKLSMKI